MRKSLLRRTHRPPRSLSERRGVCHRLIRKMLGPHTQVSSALRGRGTRCGWASSRANASSVAIPTSRGGSARCETAPVRAPSGKLWLLEELHRVDQGPVNTPQERDADEAPGESQLEGAGGAAATAVE